MSPPQRTKAAAALAGGILSLLCALPGRGAENKISGIVVDSKSGKPIAGATVQLAGTDFETLANVDGQFTFSDVPKGRYIAAASKTGYLALFPNADWNRFTVTGSGEIRLRLTLTQGAVITGSVQDGAGHPVRSARVLLFVREVESLIPAGAFSSADDQGNYRLYNLPPGRYLVGAIPDGNSESALFLPVYTDLISLHAGETKTSADLTIFATAGHAIHGKVSGGARGSAAISLFSLEGFGGPLQTTTAGNDGTFQFQAVPDGSYDLTAASPATGRTGFGPLLGKDPLYGRARVEVAARDAEGIEIALQPGVSLDGQLTFERESVPKAACWEDAAVTLHAVDAIPFNRPLAEHVNARGGFQFPSLAPARYRVTVDGLKPGCFQLDFPVAAADGTSRLNLVLSTRASVATGSVHKGDKAAPGSLIALAPLDAEGNEDTKQSRFAVADEKGGYTIEDLAPGRYRALALQSYTLELLADPLFWEEHRDQTREIALKPAVPAQLDLAVQDIKGDSE